MCIALMCTHVLGPHSVALIVWLQFEEWKASEEEAIKREKQKAIKLTKSLELASAQEKRWEFAHHLFLGGVAAVCPGGYRRHSWQCVAVMSPPPALFALRDRTETDALKASLAKAKLDAQSREGKLKGDVERLQRTVSVRTASLVLCPSC